MFTLGLIDRYTSRRLSSNRPEDQTPAGTSEFF